MRIAKTLIRLGGCPGWSEFAWRTGHFVSFVMRWLKCPMPFFLCLQFVVLDAGGTIGSTNIVSEIELLYHTHAHTLMSTCAAECMRQYLNDCVEFVCDLHTISKLKVSMWPTYYISKLKVSLWPTYFIQSESKSCDLHTLSKVKVSPVTYILFPKWK